MWGINLFAYKRDVTAEIKMGAYNQGVLILCGCLLSRFYGTSMAGIHYGKLDIEVFPHILFPTHAATH